MEDIVTESQHNKLLARLLVTTQKDEDDFKASSFQNALLPKFTKQPLNHFRMHIAIDFGTHGVGMAYAFGSIDNPNICLHNKWKTMKYSCSDKSKAIVLLDENGQLMKNSTFGEDAKFKYMMAEPENRDKWMLFERFKMGLYESNYNDDDAKKQNCRNIVIAKTLKAANQKRVDSDIVFIAVFKHLQKISKEYLKRNQLTKLIYKTLKDEEIQWIVTVPAIWNDEAKFRMRQWTIDAGLVDPHVQNQCKIVYEPDCASLSMQHEICKQKRQLSNSGDWKVNWEKGEVYILVDAGGGTVDIACHEILNEDDRFGAKEVLHPSGGAWGSYYIDDEFIKLLEQIFKNEWIEEFRKDHSDKYTELLHNFQKAKCSFNPDGSKKHHNVCIPEEFLGFIQDKLELIDIEKVVSSYDKANLTLEDLYLEMDNVAWKKLFDHVMNPIIQHITGLLSQNLTKKCKYLCLVGGFSKSAYFQMKMREKFGSESKWRLQLICSQRPILSVVEGAARMGITNNYIKARILQYTYGELTRWPLWYANEQKVPFNHIKNNKIAHNKDGSKYWVNNCFDVLARKNQQVYTGQVFENITKRPSVWTKQSKKSIMCSNKEDPKTCGDGVEIGEIITKFDDDNTDLDMILQFHFSETVIKVVSFRVSEKNKKKIHYIITNENKADEWPDQPDEWEDECEDEWDDEWDDDCQDDTFEQNETGQKSIAMKQTNQTTV